MTKIDKISELIERYKEYVEEYKDLLAEHTDTSIEEKTNWITRRNVYIQVIKELEELKGHYNEE